MITALSVARCGFWADDVAPLSSLALLTLLEEEVDDGRGGGGTRFVTRAKKRRSGLIGGHGSVLFFPMPKFRVLATIRVRCADGEEVGGRIEGREGVAD